MKIEWVGTPNRYTGRAGRKPIAIVSHITAGSYPGCLSWMQNPQAQASANYLVTRAGQILQLVKDEDGAWANGAVNKPNWSLYDGINPNYYTLSIEHEGYYAKDKSGRITGNFGGDGGITEIQYQATLWLHKYLVAKHSIPVDKDHIIGHYRIDSVNRPNCPGPKFPWDRLFQDMAISKVVKIQVGSKVLEGVILADDRTYAPVRAFGEALDLSVAWDPKTGVTVGEVKVDVTVIGSTSYAPVRYLAETLGKTVAWDGATQSVVIN